jgi:hypothetical protein
MSVPEYAEAPATAPASFKPALSTKAEFNVEVIFSAFLQSQTSWRHSQVAIMTSALSTFEKSVYTAGNDGIYLDLRQAHEEKVMCIRD